MPSHSETRPSPYSPEQLMAMVLDVEKYPEFLPWCRAARIVERHADYFLGELVISFNHLTERYTSKVTALKNDIKVELVKGPFKHLTNHWRFEPTATGTNIHFHLDFEFKSKLLDTLMGGLFTRATEKMTMAFMTRADALYKKD
ncbi:MAG: type II toxin-antitoxin system RatA family toxin [Alphaproteobacteria bacterium]|nr:type II toxin-antitoxin system RatA family toxin [Alphaproteobacteria bacterium]